MIFSSVLYGNPAIVNDWSEFGMNGGAINYNNVATGTCGGTLTCGTNSISMTDGTGAFSVTPTILRALYTYHTSLGAISTTVGTLSTMTPGGSVQHTTGSGVYYPVSNIFLSVGSYSVSTLVLLNFNFSGNYTLSNIKVAIMTSNATTDLYYGYTNLPISSTVTSTTSYFPISSE